MLNVLMKEKRRFHTGVVPGFGGGGGGCLKIILTMGGEGMGGRAPLIGFGTLFYYLHVHVA